MTKFLNISTDNTLGGSSASDVLVASQKAVKDYVDQHGGGGSVAIDDTTITRNGDNEIQTVATINANTATGSTNPIYDWVGTLSEYEAQSVATTHPDWVCYIIDDLQPAPDPIRREVAERNIGELVYSLVPVTDAGLHLLDGGLLPGDGIYAAFYNYMVGIYSSAPQIFCSEADWQASVSAYGTCGKFVLDTDNVTIRLPKVTGFIEGTITASELGSLIQAGLPNITGTFGITTRYSAADMANKMSGAFTFTNQGSPAQYGSNSDVGGYVSFDASLSDSVYGNSATVQPQAIKGYVYMVIANTAKTEITVDIDDVVADLNQIRQEVQELAVNEHRVVAFQAPTADNNYTWYRKYADGWVEQGGYCVVTTGGSEVKIINLPIIMADTKYVAMRQTEFISNNNSYAAYNNGIWEPSTRKTTTAFAVLQEGNGWGPAFVWRVDGMAA